MGLFTRDSYKNGPQAFRYQRLTRPHFLRLADLRRLFAAYSNPGHQPGSVRFIASALLGADRFTGRGLSICTLLAHLPVGVCVGPIRVYRESPPPLDELGALLPPMGCCLFWRRSMRMPNLDPRATFFPVARLASLALMRPCAG